MTYKTEKRCCSRWQHRWHRKKRIGKRIGKISGFKEEFQAAKKNKNIEMI